MTARGADAPSAYTVAIEPPDQPEVIALIDALDEFQKPLYPPESHHGIDLSALSQPQVVFAVARGADGQALGCGAVVLGPELGEIKRMYVRPKLRGCGVAQALLQRLQLEALDHGCRLLALETGIHQPEALAFYERAGFVRCAPFGHYGPDPLSVFMHKPITPEAAAQARRHLAPAGDQTLPYFSK